MNCRLFNIITLELIVNTVLLNHDEIGGVKRAFTNSDKLSLQKCRAALITQAITREIKKKEITQK